MITKTKELFQTICNEFNLGKLKNSIKIDNGLINTSYKIDTSKGNFILQKLNKIFNEKVIEDYENIQSYLRTKGILVPVLLKNKFNKSYIKINNELYRIFEYIPHNSNCSINPNLRIAYEAGKLLGKFHRITSNLNFKPSFQIKDFHDISKIIEKLDNHMNSQNYKNKSKKIIKEYNIIKQEISKVKIKNFQKILIHADPKLANFLFKNQKAIAILDLDTITISNPLIDLGDALRSWCRQKPSTSKFRIEIFFSAIKGYNLESPFKFSETEAKNGMSLLTLELTARYLNDYFEENYFHFNSIKYKTRAQQNLIRARRYLEYYKNFTKITPLTNYD